MWLHLKQWNKTSTNMVERKDLLKEIPLRWRFCNDISHSCWRSTVQILPLSKTSLLSPTNFFKLQYLASPDKIFIQLTGFYHKLEIAKILQVWFICYTSHKFIVTLICKFNKKVLNLLCTSYSQAHFILRDHFTNLTYLLTLRIYQSQRT